MSLDDKLRALSCVLLATLALAPLGCGGCQDAQGDGSTPSEPVDMGAAPDGVSPTEPLASLRPRVRRKRGAVWGSELARGLELPRADLCLELGRYDCITEVHNLALGGVDPYSGSIYTPLAMPPVTAPIAVERVALAACAQRAKQDIGRGRDAAIFKELDTPTQVHREAMSRRLVTALLARHPSDADLDDLAGLWESLEGDDPTKAQEWATLACFAVATSTEMLFY